MKKSLLILLAAAALAACLMLSGCGKLFQSFVPEISDPPLSREDDLLQGSLPSGGSEGGSFSIPDLIPGLGGDWPDNEYTRQVPKPDFKILASLPGDDDFSVTFTGVTAEQAREYAEKLKSAGFDRDVELTDREVMGIAIYSFEAESESGYSVKLSCSAGVTGLVISK